MESDQKPVNSDKLPDFFEHALQVSRNFQIPYVKRRYGIPFERLTPEQFNEQEIKMCLGLISEVMVLMDAGTNWKDHTVPGQIDRDFMIEECVDVFRYLLGFMIYANISYDEFREMFAHKSRIIELKFEKLQ